ncbi:MAG: multicopper oxidase domain-containing protein [Candidatus Rokubacteria bacterium]|nr:multicopper oxidase domain-containing protein [Candidatus Rokubacteria bacterium]
MTKRSPSPIVMLASLAVSLLLVASVGGAGKPDVGDADPNVFGSHGGLGHADSNPLTDLPIGTHQANPDEGDGSGAGDAGAEEAAPTVAVQLEVVKKTVDVLGVPVEAWTFNGVVPGPIIRITEGTRLEVTLVNGHDQAHSIHTHLRYNALASDGSSDTAPLPIVPHQHNPFPAENPIGPAEPREDRDVADPGQSYTYTFFADTPGTFLYHCHVFVATEHISRGLYGLIVVYPEGWSWEDLPADELNGNTKSRVTDDQGHEYFEDVVMISEISPAGAPSPGAAIPGVPWYPSGVPTSGVTPPAVGKIHMANFRAWNDPYVVGPVRPNERTIIRVANIGDELHDWHVHSHWFDVIDKLSREKRVLYTADTLLLGPGDSAETMLTAGQPGYWFMHDHIVPQALTGMVPWLLIEGDPAPNTPPGILIDQPLDGGVVAGRVLVSGVAENFEGRELVRSVEVRVDDGSWESAQGRLGWRFAWDSTLVSDGLHTISVRAFDGVDYSPEQAVGVYVANAGLPGLGAPVQGGSSQPEDESAGGASPGWGAVTILATLALAGWFMARRRPE